MKKRNYRRTMRQQKRDRRQANKDRRFSIKEQRIAGKNKRAEGRFEMNKVRAENGLGTPLEEIGKTLGKTAIETAGKFGGNFLDFKAKTMAGDKKNLLEVVGFSDKNEDGRTNFKDILSTKKEPPTNSTGVMGFIKKKPLTFGGIVAAVLAVIAFVFKPFGGKKRRR